MLEKVGRREKMAKKVGRREKMAKKVGRREIYRPVPISSEQLRIDDDNCVNKFSLPSIDTRSKIFSNAITSNLLVKLSCLSQLPHTDNFSGH